MEPFKPFAVASRVVVLKFQEELEKRRQEVAARPPTARVLGREMPVERLPSWTQGGRGVSLPNPQDVVGGIGDILNRIAPRRPYAATPSFDLAQTPLGRTLTQPYMNAPVRPQYGLTGGAQMLTQAAQQAQAKGLAPYQALTQTALPESVTSTPYIGRPLGLAATPATWAFGPELGAQFVGGRLVGGGLGRLLAGQRGEQIGGTVGELAAPLAPVAYRGARTLATLARPAVEAKVAEMYPTVREAAVGGEASVLKLPSRAAKVSPIETAELTPEEQLRAMTSAPKGERPERTIRRLYEGGVASEMEQRDVEVADAAKLLRGADIPNVRGLRRTENATAIMDAIDYQGPIDEAITRLGLTPGQAELARTLRLGMEGETQRMLAADPNFNPREFYWPHEWQAKRTIQGVGGGQRTIGGKPFFTKPRELEGTVTEIVAQRDADITAALAAGKKAPRALDLVTWNPVEGMQRRLYKGIIYRRQLNIVQQLKQTGLAKPASEFEGEVVGWRVPKGIRPFESKPVPGDPKNYTQPWLVPNDIAAALEDHFKASIFDQKVPLKILKEAAADLKYLKVFGGLFQDFDYSMRAIAEATKGRDIRILGTPFRALARAYIPGVNARMTRLEAVGTAASDIRRRLLLEQGLNAQAGLGFMGSEYQRAAGELKLFKIPVVGRALKAFGSGSFQNAHREFLLDIGEKRMAALVEGGMDATEAAARTALDMNETFSSLPAWQSVFRDPSVRDALRVTFFSTPEQESWVRMPFRQKGFFLAILADVIVMENMASLAFNKALLPPEAYIPFNGDGSFNTHFLRAKVGKGADDRELFLDLLGQADTTLRLASGVTPMVAGAVQGKFKGPSPSVLESRLHVLPSTGFQLYGGKTWFGGEPTRGTPAQTARFLVNQAAPIPVTSVTSESARIGRNAALAQLSGINISAEALPDLRNRTAKADPDFGKPYDELDRQSKLDYKAKYPGHFATSEELPEGSPMQRSVELSEEKTRRLKEIGDQYNLDHNGAAYVAGRSDILTDIATRQDEVNKETGYTAKTDEQKAVQEWNQYIATAKAAAPGNTLSGAAFGSLEDKARSEMGNAKWALVEQARMASADPVEKQYLQDRTKMEAYFSLEDELWVKLVTNNPKCPERLKQYATYRDYIDARALEMMGQGYARENVYLDPVSKDFEKAMTPFSQGFLGKNPDVDALRAIWGYSLGVHTGKAAKFYFERTGLKARQIPSG